MSKAARAHERRSKFNIDASDCGCHFAQASPHSEMGSIKGYSGFPVLRLSETHEHITVVALVPGFGEGDLNVTLVKDVLCVSGTCASGVPLDFTPVHQGRRAADFKSELKLLADVVWSETEAQLQRGVLTIRMRKDAPSARSLIPIRLS